jgi:hypothetical protein
MTVLRSPAAREMARQVLAPGSVEAADPAGVAEGLQRVCAQVTGNLRRTVGDDGYQSLLARALALSEAEHPVLSDMFGRGQTNPRLDDLTAAVTENGPASVTAALEVLLAVLIDILSGLVGADMVRSLLDPERPPPRAPRPGHTP